MASFGHHGSSHSSSRHSHRASYGAPMTAPGVAAPAGTFAPGTKIQVGGHRVIIQKYLSEGGFAHVYLVKLPKPVDGTDEAVLKRVAVPDKEALRGMRIEVETMKRLKGHRPIVTYIDSHASEMRGGGGYEVFLLMEFCNGGGLIDFMNTRLQHRLTEPEILNIFTDIAEGVACMHYLKPALLHRDLKVENVLISAKGSSKRFKLCDFGSASPPRPAPTTVVECRLMDEDVQKHTTLQYRSPEMVDVYRKQPMNEKSDIWALGVLLYKLCYYTTPFEDQGQLAILNASYRFPSHPVFSDRMKKLIASMLRENMQSRPTIYEALKEGCAMQGKEVPIHDIYSGKTQRDARRTDSPSREHKTESAPVVGAVFSKVAPEQEKIPEIAPMRRGRPTAPATQPQPKQHQHQQPSPMRRTEGDPFAALDSGSGRKGDPDELSSRFPTLDQFSLLHDQGANFDFDTTSPTFPPGSQAPSDLNQRLTEKLADAAFASPPPTQQKTRAPSRPHSVTPVAHQPAITSPPAEPQLTKVASAPVNPDVSLAQSIIRSNPELHAISQTNSRYVSTGTMTATPPPEPYVEPSRGYQPRPSDFPRTSSMTRQSELAAGQWNKEETRPGLTPRGSSYQAPPSHVRQPSSSRPSLEGGRPRADFLEPTPRQNPPVSRPRPVSTNLESTTLDFLRERESSRPPSRPTQPSPQFTPRAHSPNPDAANDDEFSRLGASDLEFLRSMEDPEKGKSSKRSSLTSLSGSKNILAGKFSDAFKRFEGSNPSPSTSSGRAPSPRKELGRRDLTPIAGSEATDGRSDDGKYDDEDHMTPEMRREMERLRLEEEEQRVAKAQAEYRRRVADGSGAGPTPLPKSIGGVSRAVSIQNRVQSLLSEDQRAPAVQRTAQGYGKYTDSPDAAPRAEKPLPIIPRKPLGMAKVRGPAVVGGGPTHTSSAPPALISKAPAKPPAPKKPMHLNSIPTGGRPASPAKQRQPRSSSERLVGMDLPGQPVLEMTAQEKDDYIQDFTKRFPSLSSIEMVERDINPNGSHGR